MWLKSSNGKNTFNHLWEAGMANTGQKPDHSYNNILQALKRVANVVGDYKLVAKTKRKNLDLF
jgi:hypothetical protein